jgi:PGF-pre-PGF domain-containing protein
MYVTDTSNNVVQNSTKFTVADNTTPTLNVTLDLGSSQMGKRAINGTNTTDTTPTIAWNLTESIYDSANISYISVQVDSSTSNNCNKFRNFTTTVEPYVETQRNGTLTVKGPDDQVGCTGLSNGTHTARVTAVDTSGNSELYIHSFVVQTGEDMNVVLGLIRSPLDGVQAAVASVNHSNITPYHVLVFNATLDGGVSTLKNMTWVSSCNNTVNTYGNGTSVSPFNHSGCKGVEGNFSVNVTATDHAGNSVTGFFQFAVDDVAPTITVHSPADGVTASGLIELNVSAFDQMSRIDSIGYYLDGNPTLTNHTLNGTSGFLAIRQGENVTNVGASVNFTSGPHTIKFMINDSRGNVQNSSVITFIQTGPVNFDGVTNSIQNYVNSTATGFNITIRLKKDDSTYAAITATNETSGNFFEIQYDNGTTNISLVDINGSAANWGKINFTPYTNQTSFIAGLQNNWTNTILSSVWFNNSIEEFITLNNSYYGVVVLPFNISGNMSTVQEFWWIEDEDVLATRATTRNISACTGGFSATTTTPCWNYTSAGRTEIYVPHFSMVLAINDSSIPTVTLNSPASTQVVSGFIPNVTLSSDATSCKYILNITDSTKVNGQSANVSSSATAGIVGSNNICTWDEIRFKNGVYNITYNVSDAAGNLNLTSGVGLRTFTMNDGTAPATSGSISSTPGITSATVTVSANESVNVTITYGTNNGTKSTKDHETDFSASQTVTLSPLSASTLYYYNVSICDFNNNCMTNQTFSFTTNAAAAADDSSSSSSGGGGGGSSTVSTVTDSKAQVWSAVPAGSSFNLDVDKATIAVTSVSVSGVKSNLKNVELEAAALTENPLSTEAAAKVYQYLRINKKNIRDSDAESFKVGFRVTKSWLTENSLVSGDISLYRYKSGWNELVTRVTGTDSTYVNYEADTPGFSSFAIGTKSGVEVPEEVLEEEVAPGEVPEEVAPPEVVEKPKAVEAPSKAPIAWIIAAIVIILGIILIVVYQKQKKQV